MKKLCSECGKEWKGRQGEPTYPADKYTVCCDSAWGYDIPYMEPHEHIINKDKVGLLITEIESNYLGIYEIEQWAELKRELGLE